MDRYRIGRKVPSLGYKKTPCRPIEGRAFPSHAARGAQQSAPAKYALTARISVDDFRKYAAGFNVRIIVRKGKGSVTSRTPGENLTWIDSAVDFARHIHDRNPRLSGSAIATEVHAALKREGITGRGGKVPAAATILRKALTGIRPRGKSPLANLQIT